MADQPALDAARVELLVKAGLIASDKVAQALLAQDEDRNRRQPVRKLGEVIAVDAPAGLSRDAVGVRHAFAG